MSLIHKLQTTLSIAFMLATASANVVMAQTLAADDPSTSTIAKAASTSEPKKAEGPEQPDAPSENTYKITAVNAGPGHAKVLDASTSTSAPAKQPALPSPQAAADDKWHFQFSPYFWMASLHGTGGVGNRSVQVDESFSDIFHSLDFALMGVVEARKGKFVSLTDIEYVAVSDDKATPGPFFSNVNAKFKTFIFDPEVGYRVFENPAKGQFIDVLGGIRVWHVSTELDFGAGILPATQIEGSRNWVDAIVGLRGKMALSPKLFVTGKFDLGGGGSKFTWQFFGGGGYNVNEKVALILGYRVLDVDYNKNNFIYDMNQRGPIMGLGFKF